MKQRGKKLQAGLVDCMQKMDQILLQLKLDEHQQELAEINTIWQSLKANINGMMLWNRTINTVSGIIAERKLPGPYCFKRAELREAEANKRSYEKRYRKCYTKVQDRCELLTIKIKSLLGYQPSLKEQLCKILDNILNAVYNFFFTGVIVTEHCVIGIIPPKSFCFFSSPIEIKAKEGFEVLDNLAHLASSL